MTTVSKIRLTWGVIVFRAARECRAASAAFEAAPVDSQAEDRARSRLARANTAYQAARAALATGELCPYVVTL